MTNQNTQLNHPKYRADIDGLRAIAILAVLGFHAFPSILSGGFVGVDIFFVISGFLISTIIFSSFQNKKFSFLVFFGRRIRRIFPALLVVMAMCMAFGWFALFASEYQQLGKHVAGGAGFISNFVLWKESGYFDSAADSKPLLHLWSLGIEEQFYIVWPALIFVAWKRKLSLRSTILCVAGVSFLINLFLINHDRAAAFYAPQARIWELMAGAFLAYEVLFSKDCFDFRKNPNIWSFVGTAFILLTTLFLTGKNAFPGWWALFPVAGAYFIIAAGPNGWINREILSNKVLVWFGLISFPLYLWHWPLLSFSNIIKAHNVSAYWRWISIGLSVLLAWLTYRFIEKPLRFAKNEKPVTIFLIGAMILMAAVGKVCQKQDGFTFRAAEKQSQTKSDDLNYSSLLAGWDDCSFVSATIKTNGGCKILKANKDVDTIVIGDSHAGHLAAGLKELFQNRENNIAILMYAGCYPIYPQEFDGRKYFECPDNFIRKSFDFAIRSSAIKNVILSGYTALKIQENRLYENINGSDFENKNLRAFEEGLANTIMNLQKAGKNIIFLNDIPELKNDPRGCMNRPYFPEDTSNYCSISKEVFLNRTRSVGLVIGRLQARFRDVHFIDTSIAFCDDNRCFGVDGNGILLYASQDHLTPLGSKVLMKKIGTQIIQDLH